MKKGSTLFLKGVICLIGIIVLIFCYFIFPDLPNNIMAEFRVMDSLVYPAVIAFYASAVPFFFALYQAIKLLSLIDKNKVFSGLAVKTLDNIKLSAIAMSVCYLIGFPMIFQIADSDDAPGLIIIGFAFAMAPNVIAVFAAVIQRVLQNAIDIKSENDLTV